MKRICFVALLLAPALFAQPAEPGRGGRGPQGPQVVSPEVQADRRVVFRILAPQAQAVTLRAGDIQGLGTGAVQFAKGENGVWEATVGPIDPGAYRYVFVVDGVGVVDPRNPASSQSNNTIWSLVYIPGAEFMETQKVPHGAVAAVDYWSTALGKERRMHVYTPPGYESGQQKYPVFYLLHGAGDSDDSWTSEGRAGFILDNLIAAGKAKPMVVVMPAGHTSLTQGFGGGRAAAAAGASTAAAATPPRDEFLDDFVADIMPYVDKHYRVLSGRQHRAIAGLSMGGSQTLNIAFSHLDQFAYIGVYSSGILGRGATASDWEAAHLATLDNTSLKKGLKLVWFSTGEKDSLITNSKSTVEMLKKHGFDASFHESPGAHTWINWRNYLNEFAPQLFQ
jgi:enterochelin esterase-like enzyme